MAYMAFGGVLFSNFENAMGRTHPQNFQSYVRRPSARGPAGGHNDYAIAVHVISSSSSGVDRLFTCLCLKWKEKYSVKVCCIHDHESLLNREPIHAEKIFHWCGWVESLGPTHSSMRRACFLLAPRVCPRTGMLQWIIIYHSRKYKR